MQKQIVTIVSLSSGTKKAILSSQYLYGQFKPLTDIIDL